MNSNAEANPVPTRFRAFPVRSPSDRPPADGRGRLHAQPTPQPRGHRGPGLLRQHLTAVTAAAEIGAAEVAGAAIGSGNVVAVEIAWERVTEVFTGFGRRGVPAEAVAEGVVREVRDYLDSGVPVRPHLADRLLVFLALAGGGRFRTSAPTRHTTTNAEILRAFLDLDVPIEREGERTWRITVAPRDRIRKESVDEIA